MKPWHEAVNIGTCGGTERQLAEKTHIVTLVAIAIVASRAPSWTRLNACSHEWSPMCFAFTLRLCRSTPVKVPRCFICLSLA
jgi:hypothetical protein